MPIDTCQHADDDANIMGKQTVSDRLREALVRSGLPQREVARRTGIDPASLSRFINGSRGLSGLSMPAIDALAELFELELRPRASKQRKADKQ